MIRHPFSSSFRFFSLVITLLTMSQPGSVDSIKTTIEQPLNLVQINTARTFIEFRQPDTDEISDPEDRPLGGGTRKPCQSNELSVKCTDHQLTALVPLNLAGNKQDLSSAWGQTLERIPTLWFYSPYPPSAIKQAIFELWDDEGRVVAQEENLMLTETPGVIRYKPVLETDLEVGRTYRWFLLLKLDGESVYITARVKRVALPKPILKQMASMERLELAKLLAAEGIWYDTLSALEALRNKQPQHWRELLKFSGLKHIAEEPISPCCSEPK